ncbi:DegT/DnrJ/EryC1/StrS family aminotransferase [Micromonospora sp. WMMD737]|uniref:DegT/DnrJ/EryC1/StrS family aminotransferase n=1 Tax=Micromonospora sp. WMMD737 TaxID=3404113 RepID=UPI003B95641F
MNDTRYVPMPARLRAAVYDDAPTTLDLLRLARRPHQNTPAAATRALARHLASPDPVLLTDSGTSALALALRCLGIGAEDEVAVATFNCPQVVDAILAADAVPVLVDSDPVTGTLDPTSLARAITGRTRAIVLTHQFGAVADSTGELLNLARSAAIPVIDDAAQALGASLHDIPAGRLGDIGVLSFGRTKPVNCFGGGALLLTSRFQTPQLAPPGRDTVRRHALTLGYERLLRARGPAARRVLSRVLAPRPLLHDVAEALAARPAGTDPPRPMASVSAMLLEHRIRELPRNVTRWRRRAEALAELLEELPIGLPATRGKQWSGASFVLRVPPEHRWPLGAFLSSRGFQTSWVHYPLHRQRRYARYAHQEHPGSEHLWRRTLLIPCRSLTPARRVHLAALIREYFQ